VLKQRLVIAGFSIGESQIFIVREFSPIFCKVVIHEVPIFAGFLLTFGKWPYPRLSEAA
jgi:hypothetical protein